MDTKLKIETNKATKLSKNWSDISELNYWARKIGFQKTDEDYNLIENK
jgi:hypothetical protein